MVKSGSRNVPGHGQIAQREGLPEIAETLKTIAWEEAEHASHFAELNGVIKTSLKENLEMMLEGETMANNEKKPPPSWLKNVILIRPMISLMKVPGMKEDTLKCYRDYWRDIFN